MGGFAQARRQCAAAAWRSRWVDSAPRRRVGTSVTSTGTDQPTTYKYLPQKPLFGGQKLDNILTPLRATDYFGGDDRAPGLAAA